MNILMTFPIKIGKKKVPCQPSARPGLEVGAALVRSGRRQAEPGGTHLYEKNKRKVTF